MERSVITAFPRRTTASREFEITSRIRMPKPVALFLRPWIGSAVLNRRCAPGSTLTKDTPPRTMFERTISSEGQQTRSSSLRTYRLSELADAVDEAPPFHD